MVNPSTLKVFISLGTASFDYVLGPFNIRGYTVETYNKKSYKKTRDSRGLAFLNFLLRVKESLNSDRGFGFCMKNSICSQLEWSRIPKSAPKIRNFQTLVPTNAISYHMSPPYKATQGYVGPLKEVCKAMQGPLKRYIRLCTDL